MMRVASYSLRRRERRVLGTRLLEPALLAATLLFAAFVLWLNLRADAPQVNEGARLIATDLIRARSEAVRLGRNVTLTFAPDAYEVRSDGVSPQVLLSRDLDSSFPLVRVAPHFADGSFEVTFDARGLPLAEQSGVILLSSVETPGLSRCVGLGREGEVRFHATCDALEAFLVEEPSVTVSSLP